MLRLITGIKPYSKYLLIAWIIVILTVSSVPSLPTIKIDSGKSIIRLDYFIHFFEYGLLAFMAYVYFADLRFEMSQKKYAIVTAGLIFLSMADELHQILIPGRYFNVKDMLSNVLGIIAALIFCRVVFRILGGKVR